MLADYLIAAPHLIRYVRHMGGVGLALFGIAGSVLPLPGSLEVVTILLAARHRDLWWYYGAMATLGSSLGGSIFYFLGWSGGTQLLAKRLSAAQAKRWTERLLSYGFGTVVLSGLIPPPLPSSPMLLAAGAVRYPRQRFAVALVLGRGIRYLLLAYVGYLYRRRAVNMVNRFFVPTMVAGVIVIIGYAAYRWYADQRDKGRQAVTLQAVNLEAAPAEAASASSEMALPAAADSEQPGGSAATPFPNQSAI